MGSSLNLKGGTSTPKSIVETISQANSFVPGDVVRYDIPSSTWVKAQADNAENSEVAGVVSASTLSTFDITYSGFISVAALAGVSAPVLFLDSTTAGGLTASPPSAIGTVIKPVLTKTSNDTGFLVTNYLGTQIGGSSTVAIDEIQPVGTVVPFAGSVIPDSWLECNGASYEVGAYPYLYSKLQYSSGDRVPAYGYVATLTGAGVSTFNINLGDMVQFKTTAGTFGGTVSTTSALYESGADIIGIITNITGSATATGVGTATIQVIPNYNSTTKKFQFPTAVFTAGVGIPTPTGAGNYRALVTSSSTSVGTVGALRANGNLTVSTVAITHLNTPDLRGRFAIGSNATARGEIDGDLTGDTHYSAISGGYSMGVQGGQEFVVATPVSINSAATGTAVNVINNIGASSNIANMPPYTVVRYIIKASPYTRAAIIDGIDIPYTSLLVGDLRDGSLRPSGSGEDLLFKTNNGTSGTERMRLTSAGRLGIASTTPPTQLHVIASGVPHIGFGSATVFGTIGVDGSNNSVYNAWSGHVWQNGGTEKLRLSAAGELNIRSTTSSTSVTTGGLTLGGGLGVGENVNVGGGISAAGGITFSGLTRVTNTTASTSTAIGALTVAGGLGVAGALYVGGITTAGGITMGGALTVGGAAKINNATASTSTAIGALTVVGGVGIGGALNIGGGISAGGGITLGTAQLAVPTGTAPIFGARAYGGAVFTSASALTTVTGSKNITATYISSLQVRFTFDSATPMPNTNYVVMATGCNNTNAFNIKTLSKSTTSFIVEVVQRSDNSPVFQTGFIIDVVVFA